MQTYTVEAAKADFGALLYRTSKGEEVVITERERPVAKLVPMTDAPQLSELPDILAGITHHLSKEEADDFARDIEEARRLMNNPPIRNPWES